MADDDARVEAEPYTPTTDVVGDRYCNPSGKVTAGRYAERRAEFDRWLASAVTVVHHHDIESHAESFNEGYETAMAQHLADDPTVASDWLAEHDERVRRAALRATEEWLGELAVERFDTFGHGDARGATLWDVADVLRNQADGQEPR